MLLSSVRSWPDAFDATVLAFYALVFVGGPMLGYYFLVCDVRAHMRRFHHAMVVVSRCVYDLPEWVGKTKWSAGQAPPCLKSFDLTIPFTEAELLDAYRMRVKESHPDLGGDPQTFLQLQRHFEEARSLLRANPDA